MNLHDLYEQTVIDLLKGKNSAFLATLLTGLRFSWDDTIQTACTNGLQLKWNPDWFQKLDRPTRCTVLSHELWHVGYDHMGRLAHRNHQIFNMAADHAINLMLKDHGYTFNTPHLADPQYRGMAAEQIYEELIKNAVKIELPFGDDIEPAPPGKENEVIGVVVRAMTVARGSSSGFADMPADLVSWVEKLLNPKLPWDVMLNKFLSEIGYTGYDWKRPNRRYSDIYLPSRGGEGGLERIVFAFDTSGSMTDAQVEVCNTEIKAVKDRFNPKELIVMSFDTKVQDQWIFTEDDPLERLQFTGRGGTALEDLYEKVNAMGDVSALVILTDLDVHVPEAPRPPVLWVCLDNPSKTVPYGTITHMDSYDYVDG
jgi:predicted metal-dependent peptidase